MNPKNNHIQTFSILIAIVAAALLLHSACDKKSMRSKNVASKATPVKDVKDEETTSNSMDADSKNSEVATPSREVERMGPKAPAIFLTSGLSGYVEPCGCTLDITLGGIDRIVGYVDAAKKLYDGTLYVDSGDLFFEFESYKMSEIPQEKARVKLIASALKNAHLKVTTPGKFDFSLGTKFYLDTIKNIGAEILASNVEVSGKSFEAVKKFGLGKDAIVIAAVADPKRFVGVADVNVSDPAAAMKKIVATVKKNKWQSMPLILLSQGDLAFTKSMMKENPEVNFGVVGVRPRMTDQTDGVGNGVTLETYDQGRYLGVLSLVNLNKAPKNKQIQLVSGRAGGTSELEKFKQRIDHIDKSIDKIPPDPSGKPRPMVQNLRKQKKELEAKIAELKLNAIKIPDGKPTFIWQTVPIEPGLPVSPAVKQEKYAFNASLQKVNLATKREVILPKDGDAFYIGSNQCATCHVAVMQFWKKTAHAHALQTLENKGKSWDQSCIGCHVVGYEEPGGSVLGKLQYKAKFRIGPGSKLEEREKDLRNVGCEACHGPGSKHAANPISEEGKPQFIRRKAELEHPTEGKKVVCQNCHVPHHSPRFNFEQYVKQITGPGHQRSN